MKTATKKLLQIVLAVMCIVFVGAGLLGFTQGKRAYAEGTGMTAGLTEIEEPTGILHIETGNVKNMTYKGVYNVDGKIAYHFVNETVTGNGETCFVTEGTKTTEKPYVFAQRYVTGFSFSYKLINTCTNSVADKEGTSYITQILGSDGSYDVLTFNAVADGEWHEYSYTLTEKQSNKFAGFIVKMGGLSGEMLIGDVNVTVPAFVTGTVPVTAENEALYGWQYYYYVGAFSYFREGFSVTASTEGHNGNQSMVATRNVECADEMVLYSYDFAVTAGKTYEVSYFVKGSADNAADAKVSFNVSDGGTLSDTLTTIASTDTDWKEVKFGYTVQSDKLVLRASVSGKGTVYFSDVTVKEVTAGEPNTVSYRIQSIGKVSEGANDQLNPNVDEVNTAGDTTSVSKYGMHAVTATNISTDSSDGDGASLILNDGEIFKTNFTTLSDDGKMYRFSYKYKMLSTGSKNVISIRHNYYHVANGAKGDRAWYWDNTATASEWTESSLYFFGTGSGTCGLAMRAYANYLIDEISITCLDENDPMQYIANGSFSGAYLKGYTLGDNSNVAIQSDGSAVFIAENHVYDADLKGHRGYIRVNTDNLTEGKSYKLSFYTRCTSDPNWISGHRIINGAGLDFTVCYATWTKFEYDFTAAASNSILLYGPAGYGWAIYYKDIQITDAEGNTYIENTTLKNPGTTYGENAFEYGTFAGDTSFKTDWTFTGNGMVLGQKFVDGNGDWRIILNNGDTAKSAPIKVSFNVMRISDNKTGAAVATLVTDTGDVVVADANGNFNIPEGAKTVSIVYAASGYTVIKKVTTSTHTHGVACGTEMLPATYEWNGNECTAEYGYYKVCGAKSESYVTETVKATLVGDTATYTKAGTATLVATFTNEAFTEQRLENVATEMKTVDVKTLGGVSFRANEPYGLRWAAGISKADYDAIVVMYGEENVKAGVLIAPYDYVSGEFTAAALEESGKSYKLVDNLGGFNERLTAANEGYNCWFGSLVGIQEHNLDREFAGRAYIEIKDGEDTVIRYAEFVEKAHVRTAYDICKSAMADDTLDDATKIFVKSVLDKVVAVKIEDGVATLDAIAGYTAPYTVSYAEGVLTITPAAGVNAETVAKVIVNGVSKTFTVANGVVTVTVA